MKDWFKSEVDQHEQALRDGLKRKQREDAERSRRRDSFQERADNAFRTAEVLLKRFVSDAEEHGFGAAFQFGRDGQYKRFIDLRFVPSQSHPPNLMRCPAASFRISSDAELEEIEIVCCPDTHANAGAVQIKPIKDISEDFDDIVEAELKEFLRKSLAFVRGQD